jgi:hypothetical protein
MVSAVRVKNGANATMASLPATMLADGKTANLVYYSQGQARCEADVADGDAAGVLLRVIRSDPTTRGSVDGDAAAAPERAFPRWDTKINDPSRFKVLSEFNNEAVLDRETGLVWEKSPLTSAVSAQGQAIQLCMASNTGGRGGWRLPSIQELRSLVDPTVGPPGPALPAGHPFTNVQVGGLVGYWSMTNFSSDQAWLMVTSVGGPRITLKMDNTVFQWCVRGGQVAETQ